jgi:hypothetical protein
MSSETMACYTQWIAQEWERLAPALAKRFQALRAKAAALGTHNREPGHIAHLQLGWEVFTECAVAVGALTPEDRAAILEEIWRHLQGIVTHQGAALHEDTTVQRFVTLLMGGFAGKRIYVSTLDDHPPTQDGPAGPERPEAWGWTVRMETSFSGHASTTYEHGHARMVGYLDAQYLYLIPSALQEYLQHAAQATGQTWSFSPKILYRELDDAQLIATKVSHDRIDRLLVKKIHNQPLRLLHIKRLALTALAPETDDDGVTI